MKICFYIRDQNNRKQKIGKTLVLCKKFRKLFSTFHNFKSRKIFLVKFIIFATKNPMAVYFYSTKLHSILASFLI